MIEIYFDDVLIPSINYLGLTQKGKVFDDVFKLGTTLSREFELKIPESVFNPTAEEVVIKYNSNDYAHLIIDSYEYNKEVGVNTVKIKLVDKLVLANIPYDAKPIVPTTAKEILKNICLKIGVQLGNTSFTNEDYLVDFYDNNFTAREYISYIAELAGGYARIEADGKLYIRTYSNTTTNEIIPSLCEQIVIGQKHKIERVVFDNGILKYESSSDETKETLYLNPNNVYITNEDCFNALCENILNFEYWNIDTGNTLVLNETYPCDVLKFVYENNTYYTIEQFDTLNYQGAMWHGKYQLEVGSENQQETQISGRNTQVKAIKVNMNRINNTLTIAVEDIQTQKDVINTDFLQKITANTTLISQTADEINQTVTEVSGHLQDNIDGVSADLLRETQNLNGLIQANTSSIKQLATSIISTIKTTGGNNLLRNSVGYSETDFWQKTGNVTTNQDDNMSLSGSEFILTGASTLSQQYNTQPGTSYSVSCKIKHKAVGTPNQVKIEIVGQGSTMITILDTTEVNNEWKEISLAEPYVASITNPTIKITCTGDDILEITDLIVALGENNVWSGFSDEVYGKEHKLDRNGLRLSNLAGNNSSKTTSNSIQILEGENVVAELSKRVVKSDTAVITNSSTIGRLQTVVLDNDNIIEYV